MPLTAAEMSLRGRKGGHVLHSMVDSTAHTAPARAAFLASFEKKVDPDGKLSPDERNRRAEQLRKAYFADLAFKSARARRARKGGDEA